MQEGLTSLVRGLDFIAVAPFLGIDAGMDRSSWESRMASAMVEVRIQNWSLALRNTPWVNESASRFDAEAVHIS